MSDANERLEARYVWCMHCTRVPACRVSLTALGSTGAGLPLVCHARLISCPKAACNSVDKVDTSLLSTHQQSSQPLTLPNAVPVVQQLLGTQALLVLLLLLVAIMMHVSIQVLLLLTLTPGF